MNQFIVSTLIRHQLLSSVHGLQGCVPDDRFSGMIHNQHKLPKIWILFLDKSVCLWSFLPLLMSLLSFSHTMCAAVRGFLLPEAAGCCGLSTCRKWRPDCSGNCCSLFSLYIFSCHLHCSWGIFLLRHSLSLKKRDRGLMLPLQLQRVTGLSLATIIADCYYTNDGDVMVINIVRVGSDNAECGDDKY